jgi:hypothetical protein
MKKHYARLDKHLRKYCPTLVSFILFSDSKWERISRRFGERMHSISKQTSDGNTFGAETTIYDLILQAETGNVIAKSFLSLIENIFKDITSVVPSQHYSEIRKSTMNLLSDFDPTRSGYLNPLGEFQALLSLLKNLNHKLKEIEFTLPNGKTVDYCFEAPSGKEILIEVTNIHFKDGIIKNESDLISFLSGRIKNKLDDKLNGIDLPKLGKEFTILPVVWCDFEDVHKYQTAFEFVESQYEILPFCVMGQTPQEDGTYSFRFSTVKRLIESYHNVINYKSGA